MLEIALNSSSEIFRGVGSVMTDGSLFQNKLAFQLKSNLNQVCIIVWELCVIYSILFMCSVVRMLHLPNASLVLRQLFFL